ncbi:mechanosensitive ion channel domain-containing protein [Sulfitobacter sp. PS-8MA]|uniref:mechanosensitive ion channel domain-containing protein n=1 Tax=Sulfitobacter sp. PS-8MA TaxID=3237707 RepID=UPI0034C6A4C5
MFRILTCIRPLAAALAVLFLATALLAQTPPDEPEISAPEQTVEVDPTASDMRIGRRIEAIFEATGWFDDPAVRVRDGVAFLQGTATSEDQKKWARDLAARTDGVVAVVNDISVYHTVSWSLAPARAELRRMAEQGLTALPLVLLALLILPIAWGLARLISRLMRWLLQDRIHSPFLRDFIARATAAPVFLLGVYLVLQVAGLTQLALSIVGGAGVLGIIIGFAFRDIAENFLASLLLSIRRPFSRGDLIRVGDREGIVQTMDTRSTVLISAEGNHIQIPNSTVFKAVIENFTAAPKRRGDFLVGIGYDASVAQTQTVLTEVLTEHEAIFADPAPMVLVDALGASTVNIKVYYWFDGWKYSPLKLKSALLRKSKRALTDAGISMPDEAREVIFPEGIPLVEAEEPVQPSRAEDAQQQSTSPSNAEPAFSSADTDLASEAEELQQQTAPIIEEGDTDLLGETDPAGSERHNT